MAVSQVPDVPQDDDGSPKTATADEPVVAWGPVVPSVAKDVPGPTGLVFAETGARLAAFLIDGLLLEIAFAAALLIARWAIGLDPAQSRNVALVVGSVASAAYFVASWTGARRATPGQRLFRIEVIRWTDEGPLTLGAALIRWLALGDVIRLMAVIPGLALLGVARFVWFAVLFVSTALDPSRHGLHDRLARSSVVRPKGAAREHAIAVAGVAAAATVLVSLGSFEFAGQTVSGRQASATETASATTSAETASRSPSVTSDDAVAVVTLAPGQCFDAVDPPPGSTEDLAAIVRPCAEPHALETIVVITYPAGPSEGYPGERTIRQFVDPRCAAAFAAYVGRPDTQSTYDYAFLIMTESTWDGGERRVPCGVGSDDVHQKIQGSVKGANR